MNLVKEQDPYNLVDFLDLLEPSELAEDSNADLARVMGVYTHLVGKIVVIESPKASFYVSCHQLQTQLN